MQKPDRLVFPNLAELIDMLTINQIKEVLLSNNQEDYAKQIEKICHDIDLLIKEGKIELTSEYIRTIVILAQINLHIWHYKDKMSEDEDHYAEYLSFAHKLNGIRNQIKNKILQLSGKYSQAEIKTNTNTDNLSGWKISIK